ncbi:MAG: hypothetical protein MJZ00_05920 [Paludibacteraceae bacterium]|nr:hypothetical protein [Paludibacteraceae bacterium]
MKRMFIISALALGALSSCSDVIKYAKGAYEVSEQIGQTFAENEEMVELKNDLLSYGWDEFLQDLSGSQENELSGEEGPSTTEKKVLEGIERDELESLVCGINNIKNDPNAKYEEVTVSTTLGETSVKWNTKCFRNGTLVYTIDGVNGDAWYFAITKKYYYLDGRVYRKTESAIEGDSEKIKDNIYNRNGNLTVSILAKSRKVSEDPDEIGVLNYFLVKQKVSDGDVYSKVSNDTLFVGCDEEFKTYKEVYKLVDKDGDNPMPAVASELKPMLNFLNKGMIKEVKRIR